MKVLIRLHSDQNLCFSPMAHCLKSHVAQLVQNLHVGLFLACLVEGTASVIPTECITGRMILIYLQGLDGYFNIFSLAVFEENVEVLS